MPSSSRRRYDVAVTIVTKMPVRWVASSGGDAWRPSGQRPPNLQRIGAPFEDQRGVTQMRVLVLVASIAIIG